MTRLLCALVCLGLFYVAPTLIAAGPKLDEMGRVLTWSGTIAYRIDQGSPVGSVSPSVLTATSEWAFGTWRSVKTARVPRARSAVLRRTPETYEQWTAFKKRRTESAILFARGDLLRDLIGQDGREFAAVTYTWDNQSGALTRFVILLGPKSGAVDQLRKTLLHEIGHALGLSHSQNVSSDALPLHRAAMFPIVTNDVLSPNDEVWISRLYRVPDVTKLFGQFVANLTVGGKPLLGANVVAEAIDVAGVIDQSLAETHRYTCVSDFMRKGTGAIRLWVRPGRYRLFVEPIEKQFFGEARVGPYAESKEDRAFNNGLTSRTLIGEFEVSANQIVTLPKAVVSLK
jgi:matrixin